MKTKNRPRIILAGGGGNLGTLLVPLLQRNGYEPVILTRVATGGRDCREVVWDGLTFGPWVQELNGAVAVINLAGRSARCRFSRRNRWEILTSRMNTVRALAEAVRRCSHPPQTFLQVSSVSFLGARAENGELTTREFCADVGRAVEGVFFATPMRNVRRVALCFVSPATNIDHMQGFLCALTDETLHGPLTIGSPQPIYQIEPIANSRRLLRRRRLAIPTPRTSAMAK